MLDRLEKRGLIARLRSQTDRRVVMLTLTPRGKAVLESILPRVVDFWNGVLADFSHSEIRLLIGLLSRLAATAECQRESEIRARRGRVRRRPHESHERRPRQRKIS
jgi:DNA-binding PadR family transcriptional regulator